MKIIDAHGAHILDFERFHLEHNEIEEAKKLGYSVVDYIKDAESFLKKDSQNITTILPPPSPIYNYMKKGGKYDIDFFPFSYENAQLMQIMTFASRLGFENKIFPYLGFSLNNESDEYFDYLKNVSKKVHCGFKFHPLAMQTPISKFRNSKFMDFASRLKTSILVHTGKDGYSDSRELLKVAREYPRVNLCAAHFGYFKIEFLEEISKIPNLFLDTCILSSLINEIKTENNKHVNLETIPKDIRKKSKNVIFNWLINRYSLEDKILFGSDLKWTYHVDSNREKEIQFAEKLDYPSNKKDKWLFGNAKRFLKLK